MSNIKKRHSAAMKAKIAIEAVKEDKTLSELASIYEVHPNQISRWKKQFLKEIPNIFSDKRKKEKKETKDLEAQLYQQIGQLKVELDWLKKKSELLQ